MVKEFETLGVWTMPDVMAKYFGKLASLPLEPPILLFRFGTCHGQYFHVGPVFNLLTVVNEEPGNGDFAKLMDYLEGQGPVTVLHLWNDELKEHLKVKRGYRPEGEDNLQKP